MTIQVRYRDDANNPTDWRDFPDIPTGAFSYPLVIRRLGSTRGRSWEFRDTSDKATDIFGASIHAESE